MVRQILVNRGTMQFAMDLQPRFDYARQPTTVEVSDGGAVFRSDGQELTLHTVGARIGPGHPAEAAGPQGLRAAWTLREGQSAGVVLESMGGQPRRLSPGEVERLARDTLGFWRDWLGQCTYRGRWREMVARSAMTLKLMTYAPTGAPWWPRPRRACPSRSAASATGTTATPGSGTPRSRSTPCSGWATGRRRPVRHLDAGPGHRAGRATDPVR